MSAPVTTLMGRLSAGVRRWFAPTLLSSGLLLAAAALFHLDSSGLGDARISAGSLMITMFLALAAIVLASQAWAYALRCTADHAIGLPRAFDHVAMVLIGKYVPGKVSGIAARVLDLQGTVEARKVLGATAIEQLGALFAASLVALAFAAGATSIALGAVTLTLGFVLSFYASRPLAWAARLLDKHHAHDETAWRRPKLAGASLRFQLVQWLALGGLAGVLTADLNAGISISDALWSAGMFAGAVVAGQLAFVFPGGIGPRELVFVALATPALGIESATVLALVMRIATTAVDLLAGGIYVMRRLMRFRRVEN